jgi:hypothetical protein
MVMPADGMKLDRLGEGGEQPSSLQARAGAFLHQARTTTGLRETDIARMERELLGRAHARRRIRLLPVLAALAVLLVAGSGLAVVGGWRPRLPFMERPPAPSRSARPKARAGIRVEPLAVPLGDAEHSATQAPDKDPAPHPQAAPRRMARADYPPTSEPPPNELPQAEGALSIEARSLAEALARWRRDGNAEAALALLAAHERHFAGGALSVEAKVARAEILLALERRDQALLVLDSLGLARLPRARELETIRGELRVRAGRCQEARVDLARVLAGGGGDDLGKRATRAMASCP